MNQKYSHLLTYLLLIVFILIGFSAGYFIKPYLSKNPQEIKVPLPSGILTSPLIDTFYANVEGVVVEKNADNMILEKNSQRIKIFIDEDIGRTTFVKKDTEIKYSDIGIGDHLKGGISIIVKPTPVNASKQRNTGDIIGHRFTVI